MTTENLFSNPLIVLFLIMGIGLILGNISIRGISLGLSGVLFMALLAGHYGLHVPAGIGDLGLAIFVYCIGLGTGNRFFSSLSNQGGKLACLSLLIVAISAATTCILGYIFKIPADLSAGIFAGACTSTPALAAASETMTTLTGQSSGVSIGYGIAYPFGVIGVVLFVQLVPSLLRLNLEQESKQNLKTDDDNIVIKLIQVHRENLVGAPISSCSLIEKLHCRIIRIVHNNRLEPLSPNDRFEINSEVLIVGTRQHIEMAAEFLGTIIKNPYAIDSTRERRELIVTNPSIAGKKCNALDLLERDHVIISRISRLGFTFVPSAETILQRNDVLTVVGQIQDIESFARKIGHRSNSINATDIMSLAFGIALGIVVGMIQVKFPGGTSLSLGIAGGPLIAALILGHFGKIGPIVGYIPRPSRILLQDLGLILFLADAGIRGGADLIETVHLYGIVVFIIGILVTSLPMSLAYIIGMKCFKMNILECLGGICGGMTSTPALGTISAKTDSQLPIISYATAYPVALILMTLGSRFIISFLR